MRALTAQAACVLVVTALAGCSNMVGTADPPQPIAENPNPFTYKTADYPFDVGFAAAATAPSANELKRLQGFLQTSSARPGDKVTVSSDNSPLGQTRSARVRDVLARAGLAPVAGVNVTLSPNTVALVLHETVVVPPPVCGDWPVFAGDQPSNAPAMFLGCAMRNNLYQMVVDKRDLAVGQTPGPADAEPGMRAVQKYREGIPDKKDSASGGDSDNAAADSATGAASAAAGMADSGTSTTGSSNGQ